MKKTHLRRSSLFWKNHIQNFKESGLSIRTYCSQHNLAKSTLRDKLKVLDIKSDLQLVAIPENLINNSAPTASAGVYLEFANGVKLQIENNFNSESLVRIVQSISGI